MVQGEVTIYFDARTNSTQRPIYEDDVMLFNLEGQKAKIYRILRVEPIDKPHWFEITMKEAKDAGVH